MLTTFPCSQVTRDGYMTGGCVMVDGITADAASHPALSRLFTVCLRVNIQRSFVHAGIRVSIVLTHPMQRRAAFATMLYSVMVQLSGSPRRLGLRSYLRSTSLPQAFYSPLLFSVHNYFSRWARRSFLCLPLYRVPCSWRCESLGFQT